MTLEYLVKEISKNADWYAKKFNVTVNKEFAALNLVKEIGVQGGTSNRAGN